MAPPPHVFEPAARFSYQAVFRSGRFGPARDGLVNPPDWPVHRSNPIMTSTLAVTGAISYTSRSAFCAST